MPYSFRLILLCAALLLGGCGAEDAETPGEEQQNAAVQPPVGQPPSPPEPEAPRDDSAPTPGEPTPENDGISPAPTAQPSAPENANTAPADTDPEPAPVTAESDPEEILERVERAYEDVRSLRAAFVQRVDVPLLGTEQQSRGTLFQRRPDKFAMRFADPAGDVLVADGEWFWMYYPSTDRTQVIRTAMTGGTESIDLQQEFLRDASERYVATYVGDEAVGGRPAQLLELRPRGESPYRLVKVWVDERDDLVRRFEIVEQNESVRRVELSELELNVAIPDTVFQFDPPPGTQVFTQ